ncbi:MAG: hypothetical protein K2X94_03275 [Amoebophilaceae bacterium]|nr:hypothetical protein [Amoebophilaceae bacterium]
MAGRHANTPPQAELQAAVDKLIEQRILPRERCMNQGQADDNWLDWPLLLDCPR